MRSLLLFCLLLASLPACRPQPKPIAYGSDACHFCKMTVVDPQHAALAVTDKGRQYAFDAIECLVAYLHRSDTSTFAYLLVNDYTAPGELLPARQAYYLISPNIPSPMGAYLSAFSGPMAAEAVQATHGGQTYSWPALWTELQ